MAEHAHDHAHGPATGSRAFAVGIGLNLAFVLVEVVFGLRAHSLALLSDAGHNLGDVLGLALAWGALLAGRLPRTPRRTYGMRRASILAALANALILVLATGAIAWEAIGRLRAPEPVASGVIMAVAAVGIAINGSAALLFVAGRKRDLNVRAALLHLAADAAVSLGVVVAGWIIGWTGWLWVDPAASLLISVVIVWGTWDLLRESLRLAMDAVPAGVDPAAVEAFLAQLPGVTAVHDLHIWGMSTTEVALTAHLVRPETGPDDALLALACRGLHDRFGIEHATLQVERESSGCERASGLAV